MNTLDEFATPSTGQCPCDEILNSSTFEELSIGAQMKTHAGAQLLASLATAAALTFTEPSSSAVEFHVSNPHELSSRVDFRSNVLELKKIVSMKKARENALASLKRRKERKREMLEKTAREDDVFFS